MRFLTDYSQKIGDVMTKENLGYCSCGNSPEQGQGNSSQAQNRETSLVDEHGYLKGLITIKDIEKTIQYPNSAKDENGRLLVGAAIGVTSDMMDRAQAL